MEPDVLLFDEPTSALDPELVGEKCCAWLTTLAEAKAVVVVTHEARLRSPCLRTLFFFLHQGRGEEGRSGAGVRQSRKTRTFTAIPEGSLK